ncbi:MAG: hypothetical protein IT437_06785 [Phycisphaerales bacterium]|nr:hypothetical protein [Phycisphaerales bacterium]
MSEAPAPAKVCVKCAQDCSRRARTKDAHGRYICRECLTKAEAARAAAPPPVEDEPVFALDDAALSAATAAAAKAERPRSCGNCGMVMGTGAVICTRCGLNTSTGKMLATDKRAGAGTKCIKCGYSLEGLAAPVCPECGTINTKEDRRRAQDRKASREVARNELIKPVVYFAISVGIVLAFFGMVGGDIPSAAARLALHYAVFVPIGCVVYFMCCLMWIGFDAPWHYTILRLAAALAISDAASLVGLVLPFMLLGLVLPVLAMGYAMHSLMDLELVDGIIMAVIMLVIQIVIGVVLSQYA